MLSRSDPPGIAAPIGKYHHVTTVPTGWDLVLLTFVAGADPVQHFFTVRDEIFAGWYPDGGVPSHSLAEVAAPADPELAVEIEAMVAIPRS